MEHWPAFEAKMRKNGESAAAIAAFKHNYQQLVAGATGLLPESSLEAVDSLPSLKKEPRSEEETTALLSRCAVLKLNGGLGTSMGLEKAKSLLTVKDDKTFLDLIVDQIRALRKKHNATTRCILMNSFATSDDTTAYLDKHHPWLTKEQGWELLQSASPKVDAATLAPATCAASPELEWCPPGHGDVYPSLAGSGLLDKLLQDGVRYLFVSNADNLGATLDLDILAFFARSGAPFLMEVCRRTNADKKGGHLARRKGDASALLLRESAQCPDEDKAAFEDVERHRFFNTNNLWVDLEALKKVLDASSNACLELPLIRNKKTVNPRDASSAPVFQLETAMGAAIECFPGATALVVPRSRFAPVKTCADLLLLRSDAYEIDAAGSVRCVKDPAPLVKLDDKHYKLVDALDKLVLEMPSLYQASSLTVQGPVEFGPGLVVCGDVVIVNKGSKAVRVEQQMLVSDTFDLTEK
ncbi:UTP--glucose-1-phosphate uridylyltransferase [Helicosporidium sp. ATCC 50920]|nr:UTP--glucose-1-phosphate uridylyltransferase [Helicosporidium sp. ATCC 50920]|eukprot:KDD74674.1 UTP--glucose-1-phosphate uridylyltransferase [Helicosporidium sp. ATCC 50920]